ncbi:MAG: Co2+/Mg2+ efflux protein ApaG [Flavobacteriaceae bacterium]|jgi:ApaG protein|nr:Co2+/Mg2+ efflux protein ApaG [Flavobacteriaceae bacterium]
MIVRNSAKGIVVHVKQRYEGNFMKGESFRYAFSYRIKITNNTSKTIQIRKRYWNIVDALNITEVVEGDGIVGMQPILQPGDVHEYQSGCVLHSHFGMMYGYYTVLSVDDEVEFKVPIPRFKLVATFALN